MSSSNSVSITGTLIAGPPSVGENEFPSGVTNLSFQLCPAQKQAQAHTGAMVRTYNSPSAYVTMDGVGTGEQVEQANLVYVRSSAPMTLRITTAVPSAADLVAEIPVAGLFILETDVSHYIKLVEIKGSGTVEHYASGIM